MDGLNCTKRVCGYLFELEAVDLGSLSTLALVYVNDDVVAEDGASLLSAAALPHLTFEFKCL